MANPTPWKTNDWFVSEWNYAPEVTKDFKFAKNIKIHDVTLRDGEQQTGVILSKDEKIRIAEGLAEAGVHRIEAGMPIVSPSDNDAIKEIVKRNLGPQIFSFARLTSSFMQRANEKICGPRLRLTISLMASLSDGETIGMPASMRCTPASALSLIHIS